MKSPWAELVIFTPLIFAIFFALIVAYRYLRKLPSELSFKRDLIKGEMEHDIELERGIKAGISAELIILPFFLLFLIAISELDSIVYITFFFINSVIVGVFLGGFYAVLYTRLPSDLPAIKGMFIGVVYAFYRMFRYYRSLTIVTYSFIIIIDIFIFGFLIGTFWIYLKQKEEEFFIHSFEEFKILNYYFQIYSGWARGRREMVMISIIINQQISLEIEESMAGLSKKFAEKMQSEEDIFKGFYISDIKSHEEEKDNILKYEALIKKMVQDLCWETVEETKKKSEEEKITLLLNDRYIVESLEKMLGELKIISSEINKIQNPPKADSDVRTAISNLNKIIDDLYDGFMEKMASLDIEDEEGLFPSEEDMEIDKDKSKIELLQVLQGEIDSNKKKEEENGNWQIKCIGI